MAPCVITPGDLARTAVLFAFIAAGLLGGTFAAFGDEFTATAAPEVTAEEPVTITHENGAEPVISSLAGEDLDEGRIIRLAEKAIVVAPPGCWICRVDGGFVIWTVLDKDGQVTEEQPKPEETQLAKVPEDLAKDNPAQGATVWFLTKAVDGSCPPCDVWEAEDLPKLKEAGVTVHTVRRPDHKELTPTFIMAGVGKSPVQRTGRYPNWTDAKGILEFLDL